MFTSRHTSLNQRIKYRGGWSSSQLELFDDPSRRSNCCALICCGVFLSDRTAYLLNNENVPNWRKRRCINFIIPVLIILLIYVQSLLTAIDEDGIGSGIGVLYLLYLILIGWLVYICIRGNMSRHLTRSAVFQRMRENNGLPTEGDEVNMEAYRIAKATSCCHCYGNDKELVEITSNEEAPDDIHQDVQIPDLSTCLFRTWSKLCCGTCFQCWWQCCGMCAIAQEDREMQTILAKEGNAENLQIDYITHQKYSEYYPMIQHVQSNEIMDFQSHYGTLSTLSQRIVKYFLYLQVVSAVLYSLSNQPYQFLLQLGVLAQAFIFLYFIYWKWNRLDISLDSVIKYFASGYVIGVFQAMLVETVLSIVPAILWLYIFLTEAEEEAENESVTFDEFMKDGMNQQKILDNLLGIDIIFLFYIAFIVAACVEELCKYYCYFTLETPELLESVSQQQQQSNSKAKQAKYVQIGMMSAALGFACKENMQYVLSSPNTHDELVTLVVRSLLPVHPLCAAIQSIGVVRRDVELDPSYQLGRNIFPAILLHGFYDFALMIYAFAFAGDEEGQYVDETQAQMTFENVFPPTVIGAFFMVIGIGYYYTQVKRQQERLKEDNNVNFEITTFQINDHENDNLVIT